MGRSAQLGGRVTPQATSRGRKGPLVATEELHDVEASHPSILHGPGAGVRHRVKLSEFGLHVCLKADKGSLVPHLVAVVWCGEDGDGLAVMINLIPLVLALVAPHEKFQVVGLQKPLSHVGPKGHAHPPLALLAARDVDRVRPQQLSHRARVIGRLTVPVNLPEVLKICLVLGKETPVQHKHLVVDDVGEGQPPEGVSEEVHHVLGVLVHYLTLESVHLVHVDRLVVASV
mmetsp:Transcript_2866/g.6499  ORF Transcript_2866/g.6499 Transcript_2866/m.6499 type:complete len:230 (-) Transcript_2866:1055-1744(-)